MQSLHEMVCRLLTGHAKNVPDTTDGRSVRRCLDCMAVFEIPAELRNSSGVFRRIDERVALESRLKGRG